MSHPYPYGYCGMPCALCSRYRAQGTSRCPGCSADGYYTDMCKAHHCCKESGIGHCGACAQYPCAKLGGMGDFRDLNTHDAKKRTCAHIASGGFDAWYKDYVQKADLLTEALETYNNGRMKRYLCELFIQLELHDLETIMNAARGIQAQPKERGKAFQAIVSAYTTEVKSDGTAF